MNVVGSNMKAEQAENRGNERFKLKRSRNLKHPLEKQLLHYDSPSKLLKENICNHSTSYNGLCGECGKSIIDAQGVPLDYISKGLKVHSDELARQCNAHMSSLLRHKKLYLVLDLDHTLLNSTSALTKEEAYLYNHIDSFQDISKGSLFLLHNIGMMTKLRPYVRTFLKEASKMFEMYIYTMGERSYAKEMTRLLDPGNLYFHSGPISKSDCTERHRKGLDVVLGKENAVLVLDDTEDVWPRDKDNLILMKRYLYFSSSHEQFSSDKSKALSVLRRDEDEDVILATILGVLKKIHDRFFDLEEGDDFATRDVRQILKEIRKEVLRNCKIVFSRVFPADFKGDDHYLWKMAQELGATCLTQTDPTVTHVISKNAGTEKSRWAVKNGKFLVDPEWLEAANYMWIRQPESQFPVA